MCTLFALLVLLQVLLFSMLHMRDKVREELSTHGNAISYHLRQDGLRSAPEHFGQALFNKRLVLSCLFDRNGRLLLAGKGVLYPDYKDLLDLNDSAEEQCDRFRADKDSHYQLVDRAITVSDPNLPRRIGTILLVAAPGSIFDYYGWSLVVFTISIAAFGMFCLWAGVYVRRVILKPIRQIANTSQRVTLYKDYSLRVRAGALREYPKEMELLIDSFNAMLAEIEDRDSRLMRKTAELEKSRAAAEAANVAKSQFLANISHELRTPLNAIIGFSTMLREEQFGKMTDPKYIEYAQDIHDSGKHLLDIINDILDLSNAESGKLTVRFEQLQLPKVIDKALNIVAGQAAERQIEIVRDIPAKLPKIIADRVRMMQVLLNIVSNAIKFSNKGGKVIIRVRAEEGRGSVNYFTIDVEDEGIGMTQDEIARAFTNFNQSDAGLNRRYEGAGLGLPLAKRLIELHHGRIILESNKGLGTKVTIRLVSDPALLD